ncbi:glycoside hydrolase family 27 protein [Bipolaris oryzae ATCC 44560]|uniref:Alpha-galactosidase n=1 Tax=Bipolaris oryzae ATCC 44560 TaxID=930090 RepID=W6Z8A4_COCMI|nr:glycoside hydrolase family 27 protein [Bipolaris oryzae ATCC 44560]EUC46195.1 glycoside hydrolase family 27 protein [Bipolaris oryzae ATCC 44560]
MGWSSWNVYRCDINETLFVEVGNLMVSLGLKDVGYSYVNIDDCWSDKDYQRDDITGRIRPDYNKFPKGIKHTAEEIHKLGLKFGIYSDSGTLTCAGYAGSLGNERLDAETFAEWGVDYLKYDNCFVPRKWQDKYRWSPDDWVADPPAGDQRTGDAETEVITVPDGYDWRSSKTFTRYKRMGDALLAANRPIQFSQCVWGNAHIDQWGNETGHSWRMWWDIGPRWEEFQNGDWGIMPILNHASFFINSTDFWGHGDWDMLQVGNGELTYQESRTHFAMWAALKSPLIIGTPLHNIKLEILEILNNKELIDFNQDPLVGPAAKPYKWGVNPDLTWNRTHPAEYWSGLSSKGVHVFVMNTLNTKQTKIIDFSEVPELDPDVAYTIIDSWTGKKLGKFKGKYKTTVDAHDTIAVRLVKASRFDYSRLQAIF